MPAVTGLLKTTIEQYHDAAILLAADDPPGALLDPDQSGEAKRVIETVELQGLEILLYQLLFAIGLGQPDPDDDCADQGVTLVVDAFGEASAHNRKAELTVAIEKLLQKLLLCGFVEFALLQQSVDFRVAFDETIVHLLHVIVGRKEHQVVAGAYAVTARDRLANDVDISFALAVTRIDVVTDTNAEMPGWKRRLKHKALAILLESECLLKIICRGQGRLKTRKPRETGDNNRAGIRMRSGTAVSFRVS